MDTIVVSVLLPMFNAASFIEASVKSILWQTFPFFELIIIDDCSSDNSVQIVKSLKDSRIILVEKEQNTGYTDSLNYALKKAKGKYIARMDADDISFPDRFEIQVAFLNTNPEVILCGSWFEVLDTLVIIKHPELHNEISLALLDYCSIGHPTVMFRRDVFLKHNLWYDKEMEPAEDYNLWVRAMRFGKFQNIPKVLLKYRVHKKQISLIRRLTQDEHSCSAKKFHLGLLYKNIKPLVDITAPMDFKVNFKTQKLYINQYLKELEYLKMLNKSFDIFDIKAFESFCLQKKTILISKWFENAQSEYFMYLLELTNPLKGYYKNFNNKKKLNLMFRYLNLKKW